MRGWISVMELPVSEMAPVVQAKLDDHGIPSVVLNRQDSSYVGMSFAMKPVEVLVPEEHVEAAMHCLHHED
ncbi:MAG: DUF2007 domain-containing protein [Bacteroidetes bacterium]|nr:DUF2007 domain-containing protein [Bacteroidota bacterium]MDA0903242.1 DUF2007 domain-containing protein [Bacteroidota bacterium]MDA1242199.1 DUF2007 domain-containing protein [Bacteroidota bacterium]